MKRLTVLFVLLASVLTACGTQTTQQTEGHADMDMAMNHGGSGSAAQKQDGADHENGHGQGGMGHEGADTHDTGQGGAGSHEAAHGSAGTSQAEDVRAIWTFAGGKQPQAKQDTPVRIEIQQSGKPVDKFDNTHEEQLHLIVVSKDLSYFHHIHPEYKGKGVFEITTQFPAGGDYELIADFVPTGAGAMHKMEWVHVAGDAAPSVPIVPDASLTKVVDGKQVSLSFDRLAVNQEMTLTYTIADAKTKKPIDDLQPYLGAVGHVVILTEDAGQYLHVHPMDEKASGPEAKFMTTFPQSGVYKIWGQFQHNNQVFTVPFVVKVP